MGGQECQQFVVFMVMRERERERERERRQNEESLLCWDGQSWAGDNERINYILIGLYNES